jgi:hypothetical protein
MALMAADRVDPKVLEDSLRRTAAWLARRRPEISSPRPAQHQLAVKPAASTGLVKFAKALVVAVALIAGLSGAPRPVAADERPVAFIRTLGAQAVSVIRSDLPLVLKADYFDRMVRQDFDLTIPGA